MAWKGNWEQEMKGAPESHYFTWNITSALIGILSDCHWSLTSPSYIGNHSISGKTAWTGTGNDDFGNYGLVEKKGLKKGSKERQFLVTYKPGGFSCKYHNHLEGDLSYIHRSGQ